METRGLCAWSVLSILLSILLPFRLLLRTEDLVALHSASARRCFAGIGRSAAPGDLRVMRLSARVRR
jgi:hypothetical protein